MSTIPLGIYQHYKGNFYEVIGIAKHSETLEEFVVYRQKYGNKKSQPEQSSEVFFKPRNEASIIAAELRDIKPISSNEETWVRPLKMFTENVVVDGKEVQRFKLIEEKKN